MMMHNKKGMELSVMFFVTLLLTLLVFIFSINFAYRIYKGGTEIQQKLDVQSEEELKRLLVDQNAIVAVYPQAHTAKVGDQKSFGIGIRNIQKQAQEFKIVLSFAGAYTPDGKENLCPDIEQCKSFVNNKWLGNLRILKQKVPAQKLEIVPIIIQTYNQMEEGEKTKKGMFKFNVCVYDEGTEAPEEDCTINERGIVYPVGQGRIHQVEINVK